MNLCRLWLTFAAAAGLALPAVAAPAPAPAPSGSPSADALRLLGMLPRTAPLVVRTAVMSGEGVVEIERPALVPVKTRYTVTRMVARERDVTAAVRLPDGRVERVTRKVTEMIPELVEMELMVLRPSGKVEKVPVPTKACKFFIVTREGKFEALEAAKATALLKKRTAVLTGASADVDPRALELIKPGTLCVIHQPPPPMPPVPDRPPD